MTPKDRLVQLALQFFAAEPPCNCGSVHGCCVECTLQRDILALIEEEKMTLPQRRTYRIFGPEGKTVSCRYLYSIAEIEEKDIPKGIESHHPLTSGDEADQRTIEDGHGKVATFYYVATHDANGEEISRPQEPKKPKTRFARISK